MFQFHGVFVVGHVVHVIVVVGFVSLASSVEVRQFVECVRVASVLVLLVQFQIGFVSTVLHLCFQSTFVMICSDIWA